MDEKVTIGKLGFFRGGMAQLVRLRIKKVTIGKQDCFRSGMVKYAGASGASTPGHYPARRYLLATANKRISLNRLAFSTFRAYIQKLIIMKADAEMMRMLTMLADLSLCGWFHCRWESR